MQYNLNTFIIKDSGISILTILNGASCGVESGIPSAILEFNNTEIKLSNQSNGFEFREFGSLLLAYFLYIKNIELNLGYNLINFNKNRLTNYISLIDQNVLTYEANKIKDISKKLNAFNFIKKIFSDFIGMEITPRISVSQNLSNNIELIFNLFEY